MNEDRKIFEWLGEGCWHEMVDEAQHDDLPLPKCQKCGIYAFPFDGADNPDYSTPEGFISLLEGVRAKGYTVAAYGIPESEYYVELRRAMMSRPDARVHADSLPQALRLAVLKLLTEGK